MHQPTNPLPKTWLFTDARNDPVLEHAIQMLPRRSGIVFRHYHLPEAAREKRFGALLRIARKHHHLVLIADRPSVARKWGADGVHGRHWKRRDTMGLLHSAPVHNSKEIRQARKNAADLFFLSPAYSTRSHPEGAPLNILQLRLLKEMCNKPTILLGGMNRQRFISNRYLKPYGWAAIDAFSHK